ncbi:hypothetical protein [Enterococcus sp. HY326]|uniref:hypothetical protein n=1 Tax=Enterococcus sp. HY326 TaxID=2971265 RepID=UPI00223EB25A|nr:hypothetical protein [Enterococcus sp. HY326]
MKKRVIVSAIGLLAVGVLTACETTTTAETTSKISEEPSTVLIPSTDEGGLNSFDSTGRLQLESYQKAQRTSESGEPAHFGEVIRIDLKDSQAKGAIAFREDYLEDDLSPRTTFWMVSHGEANDSTEENPSWHNHTSFEIPDETGQLQTVLEMPYGTFNEPNAYGVPLDEMYVRTTEKFVASNKGIYVEGETGSDRTVKFSSGTHSTNADRRFAVGIDGSEETGNDAGSNFRVINYTDAGEYKSTPLFAERSTSNVGINTSSPTSPLHVEGDTIRLAEKRTIASSTEAGQQGEFCWDDNYWYVCIAENTWKKFPLESW